MRHDAGGANRSAVALRQPPAVARQRPSESPYAFLRLPPSPKDGSHPSRLIRFSSCGSLQESIASCLTGATPRHGAKPTMCICATRRDPPGRSRPPLGTGLPPSPSPFGRFPRHTPRKKQLLATPPRVRPPLMPPPPPLPPLPPTGAPGCAMKKREEAGMRQSRHAACVPPVACPCHRLPIAAARCLEPELSPGARAIAPHAHSLTEHSPSPSPACPP